MYNRTVSHSSRHAFCRKQEKTDWIKQRCSVQNSNIFIEYMNCTLHLMVMGGSVF